MAIKIIVSGCCGKMGLRILNLAAAEGDFEIVGAVEKEGHQLLNRDIGELLGIGQLGVLVTPDLEGVIEEADVLIEFSTPSATAGHIKTCVQYKKPTVIGTTGIVDEELEVIKNAASKIPIVFSPNMSVGVNLLFSLVGEVARKLSEDYDVEIIEAHHKFKKDAPSGTAKKLAEIIQDARGKTHLKDLIYGREGLVAERKKGQIGIHAIRAGDIVGEHTVVFAGTGERIELTHRAHSRDTFAKGALMAARFIAEKSPGLYSMQDVLKAI